MIYYHIEVFDTDILYVNHNFKNSYMNYDLILFRAVKKIYSSMLRFSLIHEQKHICLRQNEFL